MNREAGKPNWEPKTKHNQTITDKLATQDSQGLTYIGKI